VVEDWALSLRQALGSRSSDDRFGTDRPRVRLRRRGSDLDCGSITRKRYPHLGQSGRDRREDKRKRTETEEREEAEERQKKQTPREKRKLPTSETLLARALNQAGVPRAVRKRKWRNDRNLCSYVAEKEKARETTETVPT